VLDSFGPTIYTVRVAFRSGVIAVLLTAIPDAPPTASAFTRQMAHEGSHTKNRRYPPLPNPRRFLVPKSWHAIAPPSDLVRSFGLFGGALSRLWISPYHVHMSQNVEADFFLCTQKRRSCPPIAIIRLGPRSRAGRKWSNHSSVVQSDSSRMLARVYMEGG